AGNMDSMVNHYTANRKRRNDDAYSPAGLIGRRPDRATLAYCQRAREAYHGVPIIAGGMEASLRRLAHYDYWSDKVRRSILTDAKPDLLVYGMGERPLVEIVGRLAAGEPVEALHDVRGVAYRLGASQSPEQDPGWGDPIVLPSFEEVAADKEAFVEMTRLIHREMNPYCARRLVQRHGRETIVVNPPAMPLSTEEMDAVYGLPFTRQPHPSYAEWKIPAFEVVKDSIQIMRGCFGGCTFCSLGAHQGRIIQSRSEESVLAEIDRVAGSRRPKFGGTISDLGGPTTNMYRMGCSRPDLQRRCRRTSCLRPSVCKWLSTDHGPLIRLLNAARRRPGVKHVYVASGVRMDLAQRSKAYVSHLVRYHTGGHLKVAPEHVDPAVLELMNKPPIACFEAFARQFAEASHGAGQRQYLVTYFMAGHPGSTLESMLEVALFLKQTGYRVEQVQEFLPGPFDLATCMYYTGIDPTTGREVYVARGQRERRLQKALLLFRRPENHRLVREALESLGRTDLIGPGKECLIPAREPPRSRATRGGPGGKPSRGSKGKPTEGKQTDSSKAEPKDAPKKPSGRRNAMGKRIRLGSKKERRRNRRR
ncbi:MAG: YgiQ family radical SAM protein, partial [Pirellulales bacterium]|nr:YgiQ family radical SAM protein [Pirellulales bacterium]